MLEDTKGILSEREMRLLSLRYGIDGGKPRTLQAVGDHFGLSRERVRQLQNIALSKLRRAYAEQPNTRVPLAPDVVRRLLAGCYPE
jgi:RNA polymerase primary sigma factor